MDDLLEHFYSYPLAAECALKRPTRRVDRPSIPLKANVMYRAVPPPLSGTEDAYAVLPSSPQQSLMQPRAGDTSQASLYDEIDAPAASPSAAAAPPVPQPRVRSELEYDDLPRATAVGGDDELYEEIDGRGRPVAVQQHGAYMDMSSALGSTPAALRFDPAYADDGAGASRAPPPRPPRNTKPWTAQEYDTSAGVATNLDLSGMMVALKQVNFDHEF